MNPLPDSIAAGRVPQALGRKRQSGTARWLPGLCAAAVLLWASSAAAQEGESRIVLHRPQVGINIGRDVMADALLVVRERILNNSVLAQDRALYAAVGWRFTERIAAEMSLDYQSAHQWVDLGIVGGFEETIRWLAVSGRGHFYLADGTAEFAPFVSGALFLGLPFASEGEVRSSSGAQIKVSSRMVEAVDELLLYGTGMGVGLEWRSRPRLDFALRAGLQYVGFSADYADEVEDPSGFNAILSRVDFRGSAVSLEAQITIRYSL